jgi:alpha-beta hydrolase superfamily lysophospholipase
MKSLIFLVALMLLLPSRPIAGQSAPLLSPAICGKGAFLFTFAGNSIGREDFEVRCEAAGYSASGRTDLKLPGSAIDLTTTFQADKEGLPVAYTAKGSIGGQPFDQAISIKDATAAVTTNGKSQELPFAKGSAILGSNIFYMFQFAMARYDAAKGGVQQVPIFPNLSMRIERAGRDEVQPAGIAAGGQKAAFDRYSVTISLSSFAVWTDARGRLALVLLPAQNFGGVREEYKDYVAALKAAINSKSKESEPDYSAPPGAPFTAEEVRVEARGFALAGTLLLPKSGNRPFPAVITITGSGQQTRDERLPIAGLEKYRPFGEIAEALAARGIAVLRVDDRGVGKSTGAETLKNASSSDFADDVRAQVDYLRKRSEIDPARIALVGHSEGGIIAPMVAASDPKIAAIVLMAGTARPGTSILADQMRDLLERDPTVSAEDRAKQLAEQQKALRAILEDREAPGVPDQMRGAWMKEFLKYDPIVTIRKVRQPVLILQGELDRQVTAEQAGMLERAAREAGNRDVTARVYPGLNHLFLPSKTGAFAEYSTLSTNRIPDDVMSALVSWLEQKLKPKN